MAKDGPKMFSFAIIATVGRRQGSGGRATGVATTFGVVEVIIFKNYEFAWGPHRVPIEAGHPCMSLAVRAFSSHEVP